MLEEIINGAEVTSAIIIILGIIWIVVVISLIVCVYNISSRQTSQDKGQDVIIRLLQDIRSQQAEMLEELKYLNDCNSKNQQNYNDEQNFFYNTSAHAYSGAEENRPNR